MNCFKCKGRGKRFCKVLKQFVCPKCCLAMLGVEVCCDETCRFLKETRVYWFSRMKLTSEKVFLKRYYYWFHNIIYSLYKIEPAISQTDREMIMRTVILDLKQEPYPPFNEEILNVRSNLIIEIVSDFMKNRSIDQSTAIRIVRSVDSFIRKIDYFKIKPDIFLYQKSILNKKEGD